MVSDAALEKVAEHLRSLDPEGSRTGGVLRATFDQLYDGQHTGRYSWDQLMKTERTHCGTLVEINLQREFRFDDGKGDEGKGLDYSIQGEQVDCKYTQKFGGWMIPSEAHGHLCLLVTASDAASKWSLGLMRARPEWLNLGRNRDAKATFNAQHRQAHAVWIHKDAELPPNVLLQLPANDREAIFGKATGQQKVDELFRRAQGLRVTRGVIATVAKQSDYMKRVRGNGGSRSRLQGEGIVILGDSQAHRDLARRLGLPVPEKGESVSSRVVPTDWRWNGPQFSMDGQAWRLASSEDPVVSAPALPNPRKAVGSDA